MIKPLTSLRFVFALMVFLTHMSFMFSYNYPGFKELYYRFFYEGYIGVGFFFMLSGFILSYTYKKLILQGQVSKAEFFLKRIARIYPLHLITLLISIPIYLIETNIDTPIFTTQNFSNLFLVQSFGTDRSYFFSCNSLSWSISNEMFFYLLFPFILIAFNKYKNISRLVLGVSCISIVCMLPYIKGNIEEHTFFYINPVIRLVDFAIGIYLFDLFLFFKDKKIQQYSTFLELFSVLILAVFIYFNSDVPQAARYSCYYWFPIFFLIFSFSFQSGILSTFLSKKWFVILGEISFSFYMFHQLVIRYFMQLNVDFFKIDNPYISMSIVFIFSLGICYLSYYLIEKPINSFFVNKIKRS